MHKTTLFLLMALLACSSAKHQQRRTAAQTEALMGTWIHVFEEDTESLQQYRRDSYPVGPARFRGSVTFAAEGVLSLLGNPAPNDAHQEQAGTWAWVDENTLSLVMPGTDTLTWQVVALTDDSLQIAK